METRVPAWAVEGLSDAELPWEVVGELVQGWEPGRVASHSGVTEGQRAVYGLVVVDSIQAGGGFLNVMRAASPLQISMALEGAELIGAGTYRDVLSTVSAVLFPDGLPDDVDEEENAWDRVEQKYGRDLDAADPWAEFDCQVDRAELHAAISRYVHANPGQFFTDTMAGEPTPQTRLAFADSVVQRKQGALTSELERAKRLIGNALLQSRQLGDPDTARECEQRLTAIDQLLHLGLVERQTALGLRSPEIPGV